jgi:septal ring factor EnvC (AmiA/AmiB activator)
VKQTIIIIFLLVICRFSLLGQTRAELEEQRKATLDEITYVDDLLQTTAKEKTESLNQLKIIGNKLNLRENVISGLREEMDLINYRNDLNITALEMMEADLIKLKSEYAKSVVNAYKSGKGIPEIAYIFSAKDFNQGYKRFKYLQQVTKYRRIEAEVIMELKTQIEKAKSKLEEDLVKMSDLRTNEEQQKSLLQGEQTKKKQIVATLGKKETQLKQDLENKKQIAKKIEAEIARVIEEERKKALTTEVTPEVKLIGDNFVENKGRLPWPVEQGIITSQFGIHKHPVLEYVTEDNDGIEITSSGETIVRSVFKGQVARVFGIQGANWTVILRHGKYLSVYTNLVNVKVKQGEDVEAKQPLAEVFIDKEDGNKAILKFCIYQERIKEDPELWLTKKR